MVRVYVVFYSRTGNTAALAQAVAEGAGRVPDTEVLLRRVAELAPQQVIDQDPRWKATQELLAPIPEADIWEMAETDAVIFGSPTRYGNMTAQLKNFIDQTGPLWVQGRLIDKVAAVFTSNSSLHSGKESTLITMIIPLFHLGFVVSGVSPALPEVERAGSFYGAASTSGPNADIPPTPQDLVVARAEGERVAWIASWIKAGKAALAGPAAGK